MFQHPTISEVAVKVVEGADKVYLQYVRWAKKHQHNPYVPKIYDVVPIDVIGHSSYTIVFLEKLDRIYTTVYNDFLEELGFYDTGDNRLSEVEIMKARDSVNSDDLRTLLNYLLTKPFSLDLHQANFMQRGQQVVFSDPLAGW